MKTQAAVRFKENTTYHTSLYIFTVTKITDHFIFIERRIGYRFIEEFRRKPTVELEERKDLLGGDLQTTEVVDYVGVKLQAVDFK